MRIKAIANRLHFINLNRLAKPTALLIIAVFAVSMLSVFTFAQASAATAASPSLHTQGSYILDSDGNAVYLRGMGVAGFAPNLILWGNGTGDQWSNQWNYNSTDAMKQTLAEMKDQWHINMVRVFIYPSWYYRDNIVPAKEDPGNYANSTTPISIKTYLRTLIEEADKQGIYVDIAPYMLTPSASSSAADPYASQGYGWQGMPMQSWDEPAQKFLQDAGYANNETGFWNWFWTDMANNYKNNSNVIFEAWNEPNVGNDNDQIPAGYMSYLQTMYSAIRGAGATNLIMMQWHMGWYPNTWGNDLSWAKQIATAIPNATNLVYTTHLYYYAPNDLTQYWKTDYEGLKAQLQEGINTMGVNAPLVVNEEGSCLQKSNNTQNDLTWWTNLLKAQYDLGVGAGAYYWLSDKGLGGVYAGESMLSSSYQPNSMGSAFIDAYKEPTKEQTQEAPASTPTSTSASTGSTPSAPSSPSPNSTATPSPSPAAPELMTSISYKSAELIDSAGLFSRFAINSGWQRFNLFALIK